MADIYFDSQHPLKLKLTNLSACYKKIWRRLVSHVGIIEDGGR